MTRATDSTQNPNFKFFNLNDCGPDVTRLANIRVKVWAKLENMADYQYLVDLNVNLPSLQFIGKTVCWSTYFVESDCS